MKKQRTADPKALVRAVVAAVGKMRKADDGAAELRDEFYAALREARGAGVKLDELARVSGLTPQRISQIAGEE